MQGSELTKHDPEDDQNLFLKYHMSQTNLIISLDIHSITNLARSDVSQFKMTIILY